MPRPPIIQSTDYTPSKPDERVGFLDLFPPREEPDSELRRYRLLSPTAGVRVSPLCLGAMSVGDQWSGYMGRTLGHEKAFEFLDYFFKAGGNFIDTANNYQDEQSEAIIGDWMEKRGIRDEIVLATKYTTFYLNKKEGLFDGTGVNYSGNHKKSLRHSVEDSLKKLRTDYIDLLYVHWWDYSTSIPELMQSLNDLVKSGKVLYLGISDTPAWIVSQANEYARHHGFAQFVVYQGLWNLSARDLERDIIPMARANGMSIAPWGVLGQGAFKTPEELEKQQRLRGGYPASEAQLKIAKVLQEVAEELGGDVKLANIGMAWARQSVADVFPIVGGTSIEQLQSNIEALNIQLNPQQIEKLNKAADFQFGFPYDMFGRDPHYLPEGKPNGFLMDAAGHIKMTNYP